MLSEQRRHKNVRTFATRTRTRPVSAVKRARTRKFPALLFGMVTLGLIATHSALNASTSGAISTDYLSWLLRSEMTHADSGAGQNDPQGGSRSGPSKSVTGERAMAVGESIRLAALRSPQVRMDRSRPQVREHNQVVIERISRGDTLSSLLQRQNISLRTIYAIARGARPVFNLSANFQTGKLVKLVFDKSGQLVSVIYPTDEGSTLLVKRTDSGDFKGTLEKGDFGIANGPTSAAGAESSAVKPGEQQVSDQAPGQAPGREIASAQGPRGSQDSDDSRSAKETKPKLARANGTIPIQVRPGDYLTGILAARNIDENVAREVAKAAKPVYDLARMLQPGKVLNMDLSPEGLLMALSYPVDDDSIFWLRRDDDKGFVPKIEKKVFDARLEAISGVIRTDGSLFAAGSRSGLTQAQSAALADLFEWDIDFARDIRAGDSFSVVREAKYYQGKRSGDGRILAAEFTNQGTTYRVVYYTNPKGESDYFDPKGQSIRKMFIRAPVDFRRISSLFSSNRKHPVFGFTRAHKGVDYAADMGTPVRAAGDGVVTHVGAKGSFGKLVLIRHNSQYTTAYAHLHRYSNDIRLGTRVRQGQVIGQVGMTGATTGPHLHYEVRVNNEQVNPLSTQMPSANPVARSYMSDFYAKTAPVLAMLKSGGTKVAALLGNGRSR